MERKVRVGLIGTSWWADMSHLPALKQDGRTEFAAICGRNRERAQEMAAKYGVAGVYTSYREMIAKGGLEAVVIAAPDDQHFDMCMVALDAGLHVMCEKPLALNAAEAKAMYDRAEAKGVRHVTNLNFRPGGEIRYARELVEQGAIGRLRDVQISFLMGYGRDPKYLWRFDRRRANGVLGDMGPHAFDILRHLCGEISRVSASLAAHVVHQGLDGKPVDPANDSAMVLVELASGAQGIVRLSALSRVADSIAYEGQIELHGEAGSLSILVHLGSGIEMRVARGDEPLQLVTLPDRHKQPMSSGAGLLVDSILGNRPVEPSFYDGWKVQQLIDAALSSHETARWVDVG